MTRTIKVILDGLLFICLVVALILFDSASSNWERAARQWEANCYWERSKMRLSDLFTERVSAPINGQCLAFVNGKRVSAPCGAVDFLDLAERNRRPLPLPTSWESCAAFANPDEDSECRETANGMIEVRKIKH